MKKQKENYFFYYVPKGIFRKKPVNGYEIPARFNIDENEYLKLVDILYGKIKELRQEFKKKEFTDEMWSNITISIQNLKFRVEYDYDDLANSDFSSYERHVIWRVKYLEITPEQCSKEEKDIIRRYSIGAKNLPRKEFYEAGIYLHEMENLVGYTTQNYDTTENTDNEELKKKKIIKNQILLSEEELNNS